MMALGAHRKFSLGDDPWIPVELIEVTSPPKAHKSRELKHKQKVIKLEKVKEIKSPKQKVEKATKPRSELEDSFKDQNSQILHCLQFLLINTSL